MSNTKAASFGMSKSELKEAIELFESKGGKFLVNRMDGIVVCTRKRFPNANTVDVSVSVMSPNEAKFRLNVGKYIAGMKMFWEDKYISVPVESLEYVLDAFAVSLEYA